MLWSNPSELDQGLKCSVHLICSFHAGQTSLHRPLDSTLISQPFPYSSDEESAFQHVAATDKDRGPVRLSSLRSYFTIFIARSYHLHLAGPHCLDISIAAAQLSCPLTQDLNCIQDAPQQNSYIHKQTRLNKLPNISGDMSILLFQLRITADAVGLVKNISENNELRTRPVPPAMCCTFREFRPIQDTPQKLRRAIRDKFLRCTGPYPAIARACPHVAVVDISLGKIHL